MKSFVLMGVPVKDVESNVAEEQITNLDNFNDDDEGEDGSDCDAANDKAQTFRKRRLSLGNLRKAGRDMEPDQRHIHTPGQGEDQKQGEEFGEDDDDGDDPCTFMKEPPPPGSHGMDNVRDMTLSKEGTEVDPEDTDDKAHSFRKRRLSLPMASHDDDKNEGDILTSSCSAGSASDPPRRRRRLDNSETLSPLKESPSSPPPPPPQRLPSRTFHASDLLSHKSISASTSNHVLYQQKNAPPQRATLDTLISPHDMPSWSQSVQQKQQQERQNGKYSSVSLPFPKHIVGTYSCQGVEPIYDINRYLEDAGQVEAGAFDADDDDDNDDDDDDNNNNLVAGMARTSNHLHHRQRTEKPPTTAAKINQDQGGVSFPYGNSADTALFAVYDGHGQGGELVSQYAMHEIQRRLEQHEMFSSNVAQAFMDTFVQVNNDLATEPYIEPQFSGTTACVGLLRKSQLICANVGDSRAVCARRKVVDDDRDSGTSHVGGGTPHYHAIPLTQDQNPDSASELARIEQMGGFVSPPPEPGLSARVWLDPECTQIGLAMARSLGDYAVKDIGVIAEPVVTVHPIQPEDDFVIFATDGVWEFITSQEAVDVVGSHLSRYDDATKACQALMELAAERWHDEEGDYRDDITALVVRLPLLWNSSTIPMAASS